jgi:RNA polymerase sigma-70 factor (ECF subfamily)
MELSDIDLANKLLAGLSEEDQTLLGMLYSEEMSVADIAEAHGLTESNVKVRAWRARKSLRKLVKKYL